MTEETKPYVGDEPATEGHVSIPPPQPPIHPLDGDPVKAAQEFEEQRKSDLDAQREEHNRRTAGGDPEP